MRIVNSTYLKLTLFISISTNAIFYLLGKEFFFLVILESILLIILLVFHFKISTIQPDSVSVWSIFKSEKFTRDRIGSFKIRSRGREAYTGSDLFLIYDSKHIVIKRFLNHSDINRIREELNSQGYKVNMDLD